MQLSEPSLSTILDRGPSRVGGKREVVRGGPPNGPAGGRRDVVRGGAPTRVRPPALVGAGREAAGVAWPTLSGRLYAPWANGGKRGPVMPARGRTRGPRPSGDPGAEAATPPQWPAG